MALFHDFTNYINIVVSKIVKLFTTNVLKLRSNFDSVSRFTVAPPPSQAINDSEASREGRRRWECHTGKGGRREFEWQTIEKRVWDALDRVSLNPHLIDIT